MRIEAITVCVGYDDFLDVVAPYNLQHLDRWIIVTTPGDEKTRDVCHKYSLQTLLTDEGKPNGDQFQKGRMIERGLHHLSADAWRLHMDADIVLPARFHHLLEAADLNEDTIYGADRLMVKDYAGWEVLQKTNFLKTGHAYHCYLATPDGFKIGTRWVSLTTGYVPIGFFQLWHSTQDLWKGVRVKSYPQHHNTACRTDVQHALQWDRKKRQLLPELIVAHLESQPSTMGANWCGRTTRRFCPLPKDCRHSQRCHHCHCRPCHHHCPYGGVV